MVIALLLHFIAYGIAFMRIALVLNFWPTLEHSANSELKLIVK